MNDKTAIEKAREALKEIANQEVGTWDKPVPFSVLYRRSVDIAREALAALDAEKPGEDARELVDRWSLDHLDKYKSARTAHDDLAVRIQSYAASYHAAQCAKCKALPEPPYV